MDNSAGFLRVFGLIGVGHIKLRNSELFVVRRKPLTESIAPKMAASTVRETSFSTSSGFGVIWMNFSQDMAQRRS